MGVAWPEELDEVIGGDQVVAHGYVTPARGVVVNPLTNFALCDRAAGTLVVNSSVAMWSKLERMRRDPQVAVAFHTRDHAVSDRPEYVLVQGDAAVPPLDDRDGWLDELGDRWERFGGQSRRVGRRWEWWMHAYHWRVNVRISAHRIVVWPDLACRGVPTAYGAPLAAAPPDPQRPPKGGSGPRVDQVRAARRAGRLPHRVLGWVGADGYPMLVPIEVLGADDRGIRLEAPPSVVPAGGRRAGLAAHWFARYTLGQHQRKLTGWLEASPDEVVYAPHTESGYWFPRSRFVYRLASGFVTRRRLRQAQRAGVVPTR